MKDLLAAALAYASGGWPVFPCAAKDKVPLTPHGFKDATTDSAVINAWWTRSPRANVAVATGSSGPDVLDVDVKDGRSGMELFTRAARAGLLRGAAAMVRTPSGGLHVWFDGSDQSGAAVGPNKALELKARGGYVLLPPSYVESDRYGYAGHYEVTERAETAGRLDFAAVRDLLAPPRPPAQRAARPGGRSDIGALVRWVEQRPAGDRNAPLFWAACRALETGQGDDALDALRDAAIRAGHDPLSSARTVDSARRRVRGVA